MVPLAALLSLVAASGPAGDLASAAPAPSASVMRLVLPPWAPVATSPRAGPGAPACSGDVCQPRVAVPGFEPKLTMRGKRTELALALLDHARVEPLATLVWVMAATGLRLDYTPAVLDEGGGLSYGHGGWGHLQVLLRWRIDAESAPVWPVRHR